MVGRLSTVPCAMFLAALFLAVPAYGSEGEFGLESVEAALSSQQAGDHPDLTTVLQITTNSTGDVTGATRDITIDLPPGFTGNPDAVSKCTAAQLTSGLEGCSVDSQVGITRVTIQLNTPGSPVATLTEPVYNMPAPGNAVGRLGFYAYIVPVFIDIGIRSQSDYGLTATIEGASSQVKFVSATTTIWGVPAASNHDPQRITPQQAYECYSEGKCASGQASGLNPAPFLSNPTACGGFLNVTFGVDSYQAPGQFSTMSASLPPISGCGKLGFAPRFSATPSSRRAASVTGLDADLSLIQDESPQGLATSQLRDAIIRLPEGMTLAPGAAQGLEACSDQQAAYREVGPSHCPDAAELGSAEFDVPGLEHPLHGAIYQRTPEPEHLFRIWLMTNEMGVDAKIPGEVMANPQTGQLTSLFLGDPQVPLRELVLHFYSGPRAPLSNPEDCSTYETHYEFSPWSGTAPVIGDALLTIDQGCNTGGFEPRSAAGTTSPLAGSFSPFVFDLAREDGEQNVAGIAVFLPAGVLAKLVGVSSCEGAAAISGDCPAASQVGRVTIAAGPGPDPLWIPQPEKARTGVYFAGPYEGAPYSLVVKVPAQAGPFDLGTVVTRAALFVDPNTAQVTVASDPLPQILAGVPISYRKIHMDIDRSKFVLNPTSCRPMKVGSAITSDRGTVADPNARFQVAGCRGLGFRPKLALRLSGKPNRGAHPELRAILRMPSAGANIAKAMVKLPNAEFLEQNHIRTICTRVQFAAEQCPTDSVYGHAMAKTPLLDRPLRGPVYLRSSSHELPDLAVDLHGQIHIVLDGRIDSVDGGIRTTFSSVPDAPVSRFVLSMMGGARGLIVNSRYLCQTPLRAVVRFIGQNGRTSAGDPILTSDDCQPHRRKHKQHQPRHVLRHGSAAG